MISDRAKKRLECGSAIREAFSLAEELKQKNGEDNVFDLSIGNPGAPVPEAVLQAIETFGCDRENAHSYMPEAGYTDVRGKIAASLNRRFRAGCGKEDIIMTQGAAGGIILTVYALLNPGDEAIVFAPYYPAYPSFINHYDARMVAVKAEEDTFLPDFSDLETKITERTKLVFVNSPGNPSGAVYPEETARHLAKILEEKQRLYGHDIYLLSDEPYRELIYTGEAPVWWPAVYQNTLVVYSFSKSLSIPGERIGYLALSPRMREKETVYRALCGAIGALGFVNATAFFQKIGAACVDETVDLAYYEENKRILLRILRNNGFPVRNPDGAFYLFLKTPVEEDRFLEAAARHGLIFVGGSAFGMDGYVRISFCSQRDVLKRSEKAFAALAKECKK